MGALQPKAAPTSNEIMQHLSKITPGTIAPGVETILPSSNDIETTPEFFSSDNNNSNSNSNRTPSDQQSPAALNSMPGPSYTGSQQPFPAPSTTATTQVQTSSDHLDIRPSISTSDPSNCADPSQFNGQSSVSADGQLYRNTPGTPFFATGPEPSFAMPSPPNWDFSVMQPFVPSSSNMTPGTSGSFNEEQLEQLVNSNNWGVWRG